MLVPLRCVNHLVMSIEIKTFWHMTPAVNPILVSKRECAITFGDNFLHTFALKAR